MRRELILLRHAKSAWPIGTRDHDRPLAPRGRENAVTAGKVLASRGRLPDLIVASPAARTTETSQLVSQAMPSVPVIFNDVIYAASWWEVLDVVRSFEPTHNQVVLIGHNPAMEDLALELAGPDSDETVVRHLRVKYPTCGMATLDSSEPWDLWGSGSARLTQFWTPRES